MAGTLRLGSNNDELVKILEGYIQSGHLNFLIGSGASLPAIPLSGGIEADINDLLQQGKHVEANLKALKFIEGVEQKQFDQEGTETKSTLSGYIRFLTVVDRLLFERKNILLTRQANIFTTNYDLFFEQAGSQIPSLILNDGFDRSAAIGLDFPLAPERFFDRIYRSGVLYGYQAEMPTINLIKIHGSLNWKKTGTGVCYRSGTIKPLTSAQLKNAADVEASLLDRGLILPNLKKFESALMDRVYYDLLRMLSNSLDRENSILFSFGFSFADEHILDITRRALRNPTSQLIAFAYDDAAVAAFDAKFTNHRNVKIVGPAAGGRLDFQDLNDLLSKVVPRRSAYHE
jgi:SIR2-like protein